MLIQQHAMIRLVLSYTFPEEMFSVPLPYLMSQEYKHNG